MACILWVKPLSGGQDITLRKKMIELSLNYEVYYL